MQERLYEVSNVSFQQWAIVLGSQLDGRGCVDKTQSSIQGSKDLLDSLSFLVEFSFIHVHHIVGGLGFGCGGDCLHHSCPTSLSLLTNLSKLLPQQLIETLDARCNLFPPRQPLRNGHLLISDADLGLLVGLLDCHSDCQMTQFKVPNGLALTPQGIH